MRYFDTFTGYGGFTLGIQRAFRNSERQSVGKKSEPQERSQGRERSVNQHDQVLRPANELPPLCIGFSEINKYAIQVYEKHFPYEQCENCRLAGNGQEDIRLSGGQEAVNGAGAYIPQTERPDRRFINGTQTKSNCQCKHKPYGDITKINPTELPDFDLLTGGVPCQAWSIAGKRGGFEDERGNMWFQFSRILRAKRPKYFIAENVKGLLSHDGGKSMERICEELCGCGYAIDFEILNAKDFGVPQNRERVFIIGVRLDLLDECQVF